MVRSLVVWLVIIVAKILHGIARTALLEPRVGDARARGSFIIFAIGVAFVRWIGATTRRELLAVGFLWLVLTLALEILFGRLVIGYSWQRLLADYNPAAGGLLAIGMILLALAPLIASRIRGIRAA